jgi:hypothetical protein
MKIRLGGNGQRTALFTITEVPTREKPDAIIYDLATSRVFAFNGAATALP